MSLVLLTSGVLLAGCGAGSADTNVQTEENGSTNPGDGSNTGSNPGSGDESRSLSLTAQPSNTVVYAGKSQTFSVSVSSTHPAGVIWFHKNQQVGTGTSYTINSVNTNHDGSYSCVVSDGVKTVTCNNFSLTVHQPVKITSQSGNLAHTEGDKAEFSVTATGTGPLSYQWFVNGSAISGATAASYNINDLKLTDAGSYYVKVSNAGTSAQSATVTLNVAAVVVTGTAHITWSAPTTRADNTALSSSEIKGYTLYHAESENGALASMMDMNANELSINVADLPAGTHWFAMTTTDTNDLESALSARFSVNIQ